MYKFMLKCTYTLCANFCSNAHTLCQTLFVWKGHKWHKKYQTSSVGFSHDIFCKKYFLIGFSWTEVRLVCASYPHRHFLASSYPWTVLASNTLVQIVMMITTTIIITTITIIIITIIIMSLSLRVIIMFLPVTGQLVWAWDGDVIIIMMVLMSLIKINTNNDDQVK